MSYLLVYLKKLPIFAARIRENNNVKQDTLTEREKTNMVSVREWLQPMAAEYWQHVALKVAKN